MNVVPVDVWVDEKEIATLVSESALTIRLEPGPHVFRLEYFNPYRDRGVLKRQEFSVDIRKRKLQCFVLDPVIELDTCSGDWALVSEEQAEANCANRN